MNSSDEDQPISQTTTITTKPKKERTEAQKQATAKALEALAKAREAKKLAKQNEATTTIRKTTTIKQVAPKKKANQPLTEEVIEEDEVPQVPTKKQPKETPAIPNDTSMLFFMKEINNLRNELKTLSSAKPEKKKKKVIIEESSSESEEEAVVVRRKKKNTNGTPVKVPTDAKNQVSPKETDSNALLQSIFFRNY
jgi:hypothetical protein